MKLFWMSSRIGFWAAGIGLVALASVTSKSLVADPTTDFSMTLAQSERGQTFLLMPEPQVTRVLKDKLFKDSPARAKMMARHILSLCRKYHFDPAFVLSLIEVESRFRPRVVSPAGAIGLMQLMPNTAQGIAKIAGIPFRGVTSLQDPFTNVSLGMAYLAYLRDHYAHLPTFFLVAAYNIGPSKMDQLLLKKSFKPVNTLRYYELIRRGIPYYRNYPSTHDAAKQARRRTA